MKKRLLAGLLALTLVLAGGCTSAPTGGEDISKFDAVIYVDGLIKENYLGEFDPEYLELVGITEEEAQATYEYGLEGDVEYFLYMYGIDYHTDELEEEVKTLFQQIYSHIKYSVVSAARQDDGSWSVKVEVEPVNTVQLAEADYAKAVEPFFEKYSVDTLNAMSEKEYEKVDGEWARLILDLYWDKLKETTNGTAKTVVVQLELDEDGYYIINSEDFNALDALLVDYEGGGEAV